MPPSSDPRYLDALKLPGATPTFGAALIGRAAYAMDVLPMLYAVSASTDSIALAGVAVAVYGASASVLAPVRARLIDRYGARRVLGVLTPLFGLTLAGLALATALDASGPLLIALTALIGACAPPLGPTMRVAWGALATDGALLRKGLSLDTVGEELLFLAGPAVAGLALAVASPEAVLLGLAVLSVAGGLAFVATPTVGALGPADRLRPGERRDPSLLRETGFAALLVPALIAGGISGALTVVVPLILAEEGGPTAAGVVLALFAAGSVLGGLVYGMLKIRADALRQLLGLATALLLLSSTIAATSGAAAVGVVLFAAGLFFSPILIVSYLAAHEAGGPRRRNAASTWVNTSHNLGSAAASAGAGILAQTAGGHAAMGCVVVAGLTLLAGSAALRRRR